MDSSNKTQIIVAVIGVVGVISAAILSNLDSLLGGAKEVRHDQLVTQPVGGDAPIKQALSLRYLGALDGYYYNQNEQDEISFDWAGREYSVKEGNCALYGNLVEHDTYWAVVANGVEGVCSMIDAVYIGREVGKIYPERGAVSNSGRVMRFLINFDVASLTSLSGIYSFKYTDLNDLRRQKFGYSPIK